MHYGSFPSDDVDTLVPQEHEAHLSSLLIQGVAGYRYEADDETPSNYAPRPVPHINHTPAIYRELLRRLTAYAQEYFGAESSAMLGEDFLIKKRLYQLADGVFLPEYVEPFSGQLLSQYLQHRENFQDFLNIFNSLQRFGWKKILQPAQLYRIFEHTLAGLVTELLTHLEHGRISSQQARLVVKFLDDKELLSSLNYLLRHLRFAHKQDLIQFQMLKTYLTIAKEKRKDIAEAVAIIGEKNPALLSVDCLKQLMIVSIQPQEYAHQLLFASIPEERFIQHATEEQQALVRQHWYFYRLINAEQRGGTITLSENLAPLAECLRGSHEWDLALALAQTMESHSPPTPEFFCLMIEMLQQEKDFWRIGYLGPQERILGLYTRQFDRPEQRKALMGLLLCSDKDAWPRDEYEQYLDAQLYHSQTYLRTLSVWLFIFQQPQQDLKVQAAHALLLLAWAQEAVSAISGDLKARFDEESVLLGLVLEIVAKNYPVLNDFMSQSLLQTHQEGTFAHLKKATQLGELHQEKGEVALKELLLDGGITPLWALVAWPNRLNQLNQSFDSIKDFYAKTALETSLERFEKDWSDLKESIPAEIHPLMPALFHRSFRELSTRSLKEAYHSIEDDRDNSLTEALGTWYSEINWGHSCSLFKPQQTLVLSRVDQQSDRMTPEIQEKYLSP